MVSGQTLKGGLLDDDDDDDDGYLPPGGLGLCRNCTATYADHVADKCLYSPDHFGPRLCNECSTPLARSIHDSREAFCPQCLRHRRLEGAER